MEDKSTKKRNAKKKNKTHNLNKSFGVQLNLGAILQRKVEVYKMHQYSNGNVKPNQNHNAVLSFVSHSSSSHNSFSSSSDNNDYYDEFLRNIINEKKRKSKSQKTDNLKKPLHNYQLNVRRPRGKSDAHNNIPRITNKMNSAMKIYLTPINEEKKAQSMIKKLQGNNNRREKKEMTKEKDKEKSEQCLCLTVNNETSFSIMEHKNEVNAMIIHKEKDKEKEEDIKDEKVIVNTNGNSNANGDTVANTQGNDNGNTNTNNNNISIHDNPKNKAIHSMIIQNKISHPNLHTHNNSNTKLPSLIKLFHSDKKRDRRQSDYLKDFNFNSNLNLFSPDDTTINNKKQNIISVSPFRIQMNRIPRSKYNSNEGVIGKDIRNSNSNHKRNTNTNTNSNTNNNNNNNDLYKPSSNSNTNNNECLLRESINHNSNSKHRKKELNKEFAQLIKNSMNNINSNNNNKANAANSEQSKKGIVGVNEKESKNQMTNIQVVTPIKEATIKPKKKTNWFMCCIPIKGK